MRGEFRDAKSLLLEEPLFAEPDKLTSAFEACSADDKVKKDVLGALKNLKEELNYNVGKGYDPRWPDYDDLEDLQAAVKKLKVPLDRYVATVKAS